MTSINRSMLCAAVSGLAFALAPVAASAVTFTSSSAFNAATSGLSVEDYGAYTAGTLVPDGSSLGALTYSFTTGAGLGGVVTNFYASFSGNSLAAKQLGGKPGDDYFLSGEGFTVTFPSPVTAVGIFSTTNLPVSVTLDTSAGSAATTFVVYDTTPYFGFLGFASSTPFSSASFTQLDLPFTIPKIEYGAFVGTTVPEPSTWALTLLGFAGLGYVAYHRRRKQMLFGIV